MLICSANCIYIGWEGVVFAVVVGAIWFGVIWTLAGLQARMDSDRREFLRNLYEDNTEDNDDRQI